MTNSISFLPDCDQIIFIKNGKIVGNNTYESLVESNEFFQKFVNSTFIVDQKQYNDSFSVDESLKSERSLF